MGTRCLTFVYDHDKPIINLYRQFDGYPSGHGLELARFLLPIKLINGIGVNDTENVANGMGCLAAQIVSHFKTEVGGFYLYPIDETDAWQDYEYHVYEDKVKIKSFNENIFEGTWQEFAEFCASQ